MASSFLKICNNLVISDPKSRKVISVISLSYISNLFFFNINSNKIAKQQ